MNLMLGIISLLATILVYWGSKALYKRISIIFLTPILVSSIVLLLLLMLTKTPYSSYNNGSKWLTFLLQPATVAFAVPMYKHFDLLKKYAREILSSVVLGSIVGIVTSVFFAVVCHIKPQIVESLAPRSVTTPIAMDISQTIGGTPTLTAVFVIITGILGIILGPLVIRLFSIRTTIAKGALLGMGAHGAGTSKAFEYGNLEGTISSLAMVIASIASFFLAPLIVPLLKSTLLF